jgi:hypothetical protein
MQVTLDESNPNSDVIEQIGDYLLKRTESGYEMFSGFKFIVVWNHAFAVKQLKGFVDRIEAHEYLKKKAKSNRETREYEKKLEQARNGTLEWSAKCCECGGKMTYKNFVYSCRCGNVLEV